jgi:hypothetical protein
MDDLIERLRNFEGSDALGNGDFSLMHEAVAALEAAREDAERWRWLRDRHDKTHQDWHVRDQWNNVPAIGGLDAAIDAAREARNG